MIFMLIAVGVIVVALCLHYSTRSYGLPSKSLLHGGDDHFSNWDSASSDGSDGSMPGDAWGTTYDYLGNED